MKDEKQGEKGPRPLSIRLNMLWNSAGSICNLVCQWLITVLIVRLSDGYDAAGIYSLAMSVYSTFSSLAQYRTNTYQVSDVRGEYTPGEYLMFRSLTCGGSLAIILIYAALTCRTTSLPAIALYTVYKLVTLLINVLHSTDQQAHRMDFIGKSLALQGVVSLALFLLVFSTTRSLELTLLSMALGMVAIGVLYDYPRTSLLATVRPSLSRDKALRLLIRCAPVVVAGLAIGAAPSVPRQYLSAVAGDSALGIYASVAAPVAIVQMGATYVYGPLLSYFSERFANRDWAGFRRLLLVTFGGIAVVGMVCALGIELFGELMLTLVYGESISEHLYLLQPLVLCTVITGVMWFLNDLLVSVRGFRMTLIGSIIALTVSLLVMVPAVGSLGMNGVTVANLASTLSSSVFMFVCLMTLVRREERKTAKADDGERA